MIEIEERRLCAFEQDLRAATERVVQQRHRVGHVRTQAFAERHEPRDDLVDVERVASGVFDQFVLGDRARSHRGGEAVGVDDLAGADADPSRLVGVGRPDALQGGADLVVAAHRLGDRVVRLVPGEDEVGERRHLEVGARDAPALQRVDLVEQRRQIDDDAVRDHRDHVVVEHPARDQLQRVLLVVDHDRVAGVVATLVAHDVGVLLREEVDDLGLAFVTPLGADDDGDGHGDAPRIVRTGTWHDATPTGVPRTLSIVHLNELSVRCVADTVADRERVADTAMGRHGRGRA